jgi:hypothetical protein
MDGAVVRGLYDLWEELEEQAYGIDGSRPQSFRAWDLDLHTEHFRDGGHLPTDPPRI